MLNFSISTIGPATFSPVLLPNVKHVWAVFIVFRTQRTSFLPPTSSIMLYSALEQTLSTLLSLVRNLSNTTSQSLPCLPARANNQSGICIVFTQTQKYGKKLSKLFCRTVLNPRHSAHLVKWITKNNRPVNIINDQELCDLLTAGQPSIELPSNKTISYDINASFEKCWDCISKLLNVS